MQCTRKITDSIYWVGVNDRRLNLFENIFPIPKGVSYNAYLITDEKTALLDTVDGDGKRPFFENIRYVLDGRKLDYLIVNHMEPDHCANIENLIRLYPEVTIVGNSKTFQMIDQFFDISLPETQKIVVKEKDSREIISILHRNLPLWETVRLDYPVAVLKVLVKSDAGQWEDEEYVKIEKIIGAVRELISYAELMRKERQE